MLVDQRNGWRGRFETGGKSWSSYLKDYRENRDSNQWCSTLPLENMAEYILYLEDKVEKLESHIEILEDREYIITKGKLEMTPEVAREKSARNSPINNLIEVLHHKVFDVASRGEYEFYLDGWAWLDDSNNQKALGFLKAQGYKVEVIDNPGNEWNVEYESIKVSWSA